MNQTVGFLILSEPVIKEWHPPDRPYALISIRGIGFEKPEIRHGSAHRGTLFLEFNDLREIEPGGMTRSKRKRCGRSLAASDLRWSCSCASAARELAEARVWPRLWLACSTGMTA